MDVTAWSEGVWLETRSETLWVQISGPSKPWAGLYHHHSLVIRQECLRGPKQRTQPIWVAFPNFFSGCLDKQRGVWGGSDEMPLGAQIWEGGDGETCYSGELGKRSTRNYRKDVIEMVNGILKEPHLGCLEITQRSGAGPLLVFRQRKHSRWAGKTEKDLVVGKRRGRHPKQDACKEQETKDPLHICFWNKLYPWCVTLLSIPVSHPYLSVLDLSTGIDHRSFWLGASQPNMMGTCLPQRWANLFWKGLKTPSCLWVPSFRQLSCCTKCNKVSGKEQDGPSVGKASLGSNAGLVKAQALFSLHPNGPHLRN
jgi:hypothetical protein